MQPQAAHLMSFAEHLPFVQLNAESLGIKLTERLSCNGRYDPRLGLLIKALCTRIGQQDVTAVRELWRLGQGLTFGGALSAGNLQRLQGQLNLLHPQWSGE